MRYSENRTRRWSTICWMARSFLFRTDFPLLSSRNTISRSDHSERPSKIIESHHFPMKTISFGAYGKLGSAGRIFSYTSPKMLLRDHWIARFLIHCFSWSESIFIIKIPIKKPSNQPNMRVTISIYFSLPFYNFSILSSYYEKSRNLL